MAFAAAVVVAALGAAGCRQDMHQAPRYDPLERSDFFVDQRASRPIVEGTVARGQLRADKVLYTGKNGTQFVNQLPMPLTRTLLARGQERFTIYCTPCHAASGDGDGMIVQRGFKRPPSLHDPVVSSQPIGYYYDVITNGFGAMQDYAAQVQPEDRWAIAAYLRVLQYSRRVPADALSEADRRLVENGGPESAGAQGEAAGHE
ncbi:MAG: cytochrome c [Vicinamibacterales bacterium]